MEKRFYFVLGDLVTSVVAAIATTGLAVWLIGGAFGMVPGMLVGMLLGMVVALFLTLLISPLLGLMEVLTLGMLSGMIGGMWGGMWPLSGGEIVRWGAGTGVAVFVVIYLLNAAMTGPQRLRN